MRQLPTGTVTFLFTDIEGSTRLLDELGPERYARALAEHRRALRAAFAAYGGVEVDTQGDAFFYAFPRATEAVAAAEAGRSALASSPIRVRVGLHTGEPVTTGEGYVGVDVHRAARIAAAGHGGQVIISQTTRDLLDETVVVRDLGEHRLKDLTAGVRLYQLGTEEFPPLKTLYGTNLPIQPSPLVGRERELAEAGALLAETRLLTFVGPGGSGKTRLALQLAAESVEAFENGVFFVPLQSIGDPELVLPTIAQTIGASNGLADAVGDRRILLLLDNLEQLLDAAPNLADVLTRTPNLKVLATSRELLRIAGEREYAVDPLAERDAVALFTSRAAQAEPASAVGEICRRLDCLPLAVELAAARTTLLAPDELLARLDRRLPLLTVGRRDMPERQRTLRATIEWSYDLLSDDERTLFRRLAVFTGSFTPEGAEAVCGADLDALQSLVDKSLVRRWGSGRFGMLETIHEYATELLADSDEAEERRLRHAEFILAVAESANLAAHVEGEQHHELVIPERDNIRAALEWTLAARRTELGLRIAVALENYWASAAQFEGGRWFEQLLAVATDIPQRLRAHALRCHGSAIYVVGDFELGRRRFDESLAEFRKLGDERNIAILLHRQAVDEFFQRGNLDGAVALAEESLELHHASGFDKGACQALSLLGAAAMDRGELDRAKELYEASERAAATSGFYWWQASTLGALAELALARGDRDAERLASDSLRIADRLSDRQGTVRSLALLARIAAEEGRLAVAGRRWGSVEAEEERGPVGQWETYRDEVAAPILAHAGPEFERGREEGRRLALAEAVAEALDA